MCILSFMMFFSCIDLSSISILGTIFNNTKQISISDVISVQATVLKQTKQAFSGICDNIIKDVTTILTSSKVVKTYIDLYNFSINKEYLKYCVLLVVPLIYKISSTNICRNNTKIPLIFFGFIFLFILKYLGLLFTFGKKTNSQQYKVAYSM